MPKLTVTDVGFDDSTLHGQTISISLSARAIDVQMAQSHTATARMARALMVLLGGNIILWPAFFHDVVIGLGVVNVLVHESRRHQPAQAAPGDDQLKRTF